MSYAPAVESAISNAAPLEFQNGAWISRSPDDIVLARNIPRVGKHDYPVVLPKRDELVIPPFYVPASTPSELRDIVVEYHTICRLPTTGKALEVINNEVRHERQHGEASIALGAVSCLYLLRVSRNEDGSQCAWQTALVPIGLNTTKIGWAVINTYPDQLSAGDLWQMQELGYGSVAEVGRTAKKYGLPVPLQVQKGLNIIPYRSSSQWLDAFLNPNRLGLGP